ncbi:protein SYM1-like isoform X1 [Pistacia vera]|uniref:protein SYM1-like isoform X1 n=1 Tax=Pistacia vera TaxID=55513 RepID=UPI00126306A5|nr:protein SYM1-like isoform X1 [Pistacia vera]
MGAALKRNSTISQLLQSDNKKFTDFFTDPVARIHQYTLKNQAQFRDYNKFPHFWRKSVREYNEVSPSVFSSAFSPFSSGTASLSSKAGFVRWYLGMVKSRPVLTKSITCALIYTAADLSSQTLSSSNPFDLVRTLRMAGYGMIVLGPSLHFWFNFVSKVFPKRDLITTLKKIAMGQLLYGPFMTVVFLSVNAGLQGENGEEIVARLKRDLLPTMINGVMYWPLCDFITFRFIPVHLQPLVSNSFSYLWTIYITYMASLDKAGSAPS